jgi:hypothetical protein
MEILVADYNNTKTKINTEELQEYSSSFLQFVSKQNNEILEIVQKFYKNKQDKLINYITDRFASSPILKNKKTSARKVIMTQKLKEAILEIVKMRHGILMQSATYQDGDYPAWRRIVVGGVVLFGSCGGGMECDDRAIAYNWSRFIEILQLEKKWYPGIQF